MKTAKDAKTFFMVGHIEQFNPAVEAAHTLLEKGGDVQAVEAYRMSQASARITDVDVVLDLMVHDIEVVLSFINSPIKTIEAKAVGNKGDYVTALLSFENGSIATLTASRITTNKIRSLKMTSSIGYIDLDYMDQSVSVYHQGSHPFVDEKKALFLPVDVTEEKLFIRRKDQLTEELSHFITCVQSGQMPRVTGQRATEALKVVWEIQKKAFKTC